MRRHSRRICRKASANTAEYGKFFTGLTGDHRQETRRRRIGRAGRGYVLGWLRGAADGIRRLFRDRLPPHLSGPIAGNGMGGDRDELAGGQPHEHPCPPAVRRLPLRRRQVPARNLRPAGDGTASVHSAEVSPVCILRNQEAGMFRQPHTASPAGPTRAGLHVYSDDALRGEVYGEADE